MKQFLFSTNDSWTGLILRFSLGAIMFTHGAQKSIGVFGGSGFKASMNYFTDVMKLPGLIAFAVITIEFIGSLCLIAGIGTRICAILMIAVMLGAIFTVNYKNGFFMNWYGSQQGEGYEYHLLVIAICTALLCTGGGKFSMDKLIQ
ncbi:MAG: DoxX family protein [Bacteroidetes bacterium]|nr:DoxX family protein [Bacteroidota bacterium]